MGDSGIFLSCFGFAFDCRGNGVFIFGFVRKIGFLWFNLMPCLISGKKGKMGKKKFGSGRKKFKLRTMGI